MKKRERKGFTIVELVIVIAIIAVLAAVIIPTFTSLIDKANQSADIQAARQLNTALAAGSIPDRPTNIGTVMDILDKAGFNSNSEESLRPITKRFRFCWYEEKNIILLVELPKFLDDALLATVSFTDVNKAKVWYPEDREIEGSIAYDFEVKLNELVKILWESNYVKEDGNLSGSDNETKVKIKEFLKEKVSGTDLYSIFETIFEHDLSVAKNNNGGSGYVSVTGVIFNCTELNLSINENATLTVKVEPANATEKTINWSSKDGSVATVAGGVVTAHKAGTTIITATCGGKSAECKVTVTATQTQNPLQSITIDKSVVVLAEGNSTSLTVEFNPENTTDNKTITWTSENGDVATVDSNSGEVTAKEVGVTTITAQTQDGKTATCDVIVIDLKLEPTTLELTSGGEATLDASGIPQDQRVTVQWSASPSGFVEVVGLENRKAKINAIATGEATITATVYYDNEPTEYTAKCEVTVKSSTVPVTKIELPETLTLAIGCETLPLTGALTAKILPNDATNKKVEWKVAQDGDVIAFDNDTGTVTAVGLGTATITATATDGSGKSATCTVTVCEVKLSEYSLDLNINDKPKLTLTVSAPKYSVGTLGYNEDVISVRPNTDKSAFQITPVGGGETVLRVPVTVIVGGKNHEFVAKCTVKVKSPATGIYIIEKGDVDQKRLTELDLVVDQNFALDAKLDPPDSTSKVTWSSDAPNVVTVDDKGNITAIGCGSATITASSKDEAGVKDECVVNVYKVDFKKNGKIIDGVLKFEDKTPLNVTVTVSGTGGTQYTVTNIEMSGSEVVGFSYRPNSNGRGTLTPTEKQGYETVTFTITLEDGTVLTAKLTVYYSNEIIDKLLNGGTIDLNEDFTLSGANIKVKNNVTIDLGGYTLTIDAPANDSGIDVYAGGTLTITGEGTLVINGSSSFGGIYVYPTVTPDDGTPLAPGVLVLNGVTVEHGPGLCFVNRGTLNITNCTINNTDSECADTIINGGDINGKPIEANLTINNTTINVNCPDAYWPVILNHNGSTVEFGEDVVIQGKMYSNYYGGAFNNEGYVNGTLDTTEMHYTERYHDN